MLGTKLANRYEIVREIGRGGMGVVYLAQDPILEREVAIKIVMPEQVSPDTLERFKREARIVAKMDHHSIVSVYDSGEDQASLFFVMPFVEGANLRSLLRNRSLTLGELIEVGAQVASALDYSHLRGIIHRDIKPENILVEHRQGEDLRVRITDFGLALSPAQDRLTKTATVVGTIIYMSPEQVAGRELDARSDVYSLGTVLYECLTGQPPFAGEVQTLIYRITNELPLPPRALQPELDEEIEELLLRCLEKDPSKRPGGKEVFERLSKYRNNLVNSGRHIMALPNATTLSMQYQRPVARPFVGRDKEFAELQRRLNNAMTGECQIVLITGEAGIGKSRLLDELEILAKARNLNVLHGRFAEIDRPLPYQAYCEAIQEYFRTRAPCATDRDFSDLAGDLISLFPVLAEVRELSPSGEAVRRLSEGSTKKFEDRTYIFELLARTLTRISGGKPLVILFEDLHFADVSLEALDYILRRLGPTATFIVGTYRSTEVDKRHPIHKFISGFKGDKRFALLRLGPFSRSDHRIFLEKLMGGPRLDETLAARFYQSTEGNPYFTNELIRSLIDSGGILRSATGVYTLSSENALSVEELPDTIQQTIQDRLQRLPVEQLEVLSFASILGKTFDYADLKMMAPDKSDLENNVEQLLVSGFIEEDRQSRGLRFSFSSGVLRDVLYGSVPRLRRRTLHRKCAEELEKRNKGRLERVYAPLFEHYAHADVPEKVIQFGFLLARKSLESLSPEDTIRILHTVLDFLEYAGSEDRSLMAKAKLLLGSAHRMKGNTEEALRDMEEAVHIFDELRPDAGALEAVTAAAETAWLARKVEESRRWVEKGIDLATAVNEEFALSKFLSLGATIANLRADYLKAREYLDLLEKIKPRKEERLEKIAEGGILSVAITSPFQSRHPVNATLLEEIEVFSNVFETLVCTDEQGTLLPHLCERWESLNEGAMFLFVLRKDVAFHDGRKLTTGNLKRALENAIRSCKHILPPALGAISGASHYQNGTAEEVSGVILLSENILQIRLEARLPIYPSLLSDFRTAVALPVNEGAALVGTAPFKIKSLKSDGILLEKNTEYWKGKIPHLDGIHFQPAGSLPSMMEGFRSGKFDVVRELQREDLELTLRERILHASFVEVSLKNVYFILFNQLSPLCGKLELRKALTGVLQTQDLVRSTLGRLGQPAAGFLPPGIFAHDPARRRYPIKAEKAKELIKMSGLSTPIPLKVGLNPASHARYSALLDSLFQTWSQLGVQVIKATPTQESFLKSFTDNSEIDLLLLNWIGDYDDPDAFTFGLFHSETGEFREYCSSKELDELMTNARLEKHPDAREQLYHKIENLLLNSVSIFPLFHDVNYRLAGPQVRRLSLSRNPPYVNYSEITKEEKLESRGSRSDRGILKVTLNAPLPTLDTALQTTVHEALVSSMIFESLTRAIEGARIVPWLASSFQLEDGGKRFRFRLRDGVRFHDGRIVTSRDVRYSFERLLLNQRSAMRWYLSAIRGAREILQGKSKELEGLRILSAQEFLIHLEQPLSFFPALLTNTFLSIVPEGLDNFAGGWRQGVAGTGPFRITSSEPGAMIKLEANPSYWRSGYPKSEGLEFAVETTSAETLNGFRTGRFSLAFFLETAHAESLLHETQFSAKYKEIPWLGTLFISFNTRSGFFSDPNVRRQVVDFFHAEGLMQGTRRFAVPARTLIPPALLGYEPEPPVAHRRQAKFDVEITIAFSTSATISGNLREEIIRILQELGIRTRISEARAEHLSRGATEDLILLNWYADYPDPDAVVYPLLYSTGIWGDRCGTPEVDHLIEQARIETDPDVRHALYRKIEEKIREDASVLPLFHDQFYCFARPEVEGLELNYFYPLIAFENLSIRR